MTPARSAEAARAAEATAQILLDIKAVNFRPENPYILTSGWASPVYIDCRKLISFPKERSRVIDMALDTIEREVTFAKIDAVAGGETAGIPYAAFMAQKRDMPMLYVRKQPKGFGRNAQIEGELKEGGRVLLVEDLATDGASKITFVKALRTAGLEVSEAFVVFFYGVYRGALETLAQSGLRLHYLATWHDVLAAAEKNQSFPAASIAEVRAFLDNPPAWSSSHGGRS